MQFSDRHWQISNSKIRIKKVSRTFTFRVSPSGNHLAWIYFGNVGQLNKKSEVILTVVVALDAGYIMLNVMKLMIVVPHCREWRKSDGRLAGAYSMKIGLFTVAIRTVSHP